MSWTVTIPPADEPVSIETLRAHLRADDTAENALIMQYAQAARERIEHDTRHKLITQTGSFEYDHWPDIIKLPRRPLQSIDSISYVDGDGATQILDPSQYRVNIANANVTRDWGVTWPTIRPVTGAVTVSAVVGFGADGESVDARLRLALMVLTSLMFQAREPIVTGTIVATVPYVFDMLISYRLRVEG